MVAAHGDIQSEFAIGTHQRKLVGRALVVEKLSEILLRSLDISHMDEGNALPEMARGLFKRFDRMNKIYRINIAFATWSFGVLEFFS